MKVLMLPDWHGVPKSVDLQIDLLKKYNPKETIILHEPIPSSYDKEARAFSSRNRGSRITQFWDALRLSESWGPCYPYLKLYKYVKDCGFALGALDGSICTRNELAIGFKRLVIDYKRLTESSRYSLTPPVFPNINKRFDVLKRKLCFGREVVFCENVDNARYGGFETAVVITHPAHVKRCAAYFADTQGYTVDINPLINPDPKTELGKLAAELGKAEEELQLAYAEKGKIIEKEGCPPLVPTVVTAFYEIRCSL